jgi:uncharacterized metal-binding protein YceD (DUF177 family)
MGTGAAYYKIDIQSVGIGVHQFEFAIDSKFFEKFENSSITKGKLLCQLELDRNERLITAHFIIEGTVELECDNSLELFDHPMKIDRQVIFKYGEEFEELDETTIQIPRNSDQLDVGELIFEFIILAIPMRKIHPKFEDSDESTVIYTTESNSEEEIEDIDVDPRWSALKDLKK